MTASANGDLHPLLAELIGALGQAHVRAAEPDADSLSQALLRIDALFERLRSHLAAPMQLARLTPDLREELRQILMRYEGLVAALDVRRAAAARGIASRKHIRQAISRNARPSPGRILKVQAHGEGWHHA